MGNYMIAVEAGGREKSCHLFTRKYDEVLREANFNCLGLQGFDGKGGAWRVIEAMKLLLQLATNGQAATMYLDAAKALSVLVPSFLDYPESVIRVTLDAETDNL